MQYKSLETFQPSCPVCVDLDGTLIRYHALWHPRGRFKIAWSLLPGVILRSFYSFFVRDAGPTWYGLPSSSDPLSFVCGQSWSLWSAFKWHLSQSQPMNVSMMAYCTRLVGCIKRWKDAGVALYLVTGSPEPLARAVFDHTRLFNGFLSSSPTVHLVGKTKASALVQCWGMDGFHYVGDSWMDRDVRSVSRDILTVIPPDDVLFKKILKIKRPDQCIYALG